MPLRKLSSLAILAAVTVSLPALAGEQIDPKIACRAEEIILALAGTAPDKLDFFGKRQPSGAYDCEAYFSFKVYADVWARINAMAPTLRRVEASCAYTALVKLPKVDALQLTYTISAAGSYRITSVSNGLPSDPQKLSARLRAQIAQLQQIRDADDASLYESFARKDCPLASYPDMD